MDTVWITIVDREGTVTALAGASRNSAVRAAVNDIEAGWGPGIDGEQRSALESMIATLCAVEYEWRSNDGELTVTLQECEIAP